MKPPLWSLIPYYLIGTRVPRRSLAWVEADIARPRWHPWVPRTRVFVVIAAAVAAFLGPWTDAGSWTLMTVSLGVTFLVLFVRAGSGEHERTRELRFQRRETGWDTRVQDLIAPFLEIGDASSPDGTARGAAPEPLHDHDPALRAPVADDTLVAACADCDVILQRRGDRWEHRDPHWLLYACDACGWQDAIDGSCPACTNGTLVKDAANEPPPIPRRVRVGWVAYTVVFVGALAWFLLRDERLDLLRFLR